ncbi:LPXTG cell wall anchor domain-containing protein [Actinomadura barringtoniae]|uniref:LPXTG cell wall anchor domain-containing protein n=1 Tax=Actinomadura barringtoniae TaxID=1427535 RepID=A0A939P8S9_9ACTN|nr:neocarzinostatin apoprotein domain-containing protein [Actinomadura barringtoniae]MBO2447853.1 LPXTG cell wall anchor domain-containing protein [Actinomadura barringtoniae]
MRRTRKQAATVAAITTASVLALGPPALAAPTLKMSKTTGLKAGDKIDVVSLTGLKPNLASVAIGQCKPVVTGTADCDISGALLGTADGSGKWKPGAKGSTITLLAKIGSTSCTAKAGACIIGVTSLTDPTNVLVKVPLTFSSSGGNGSGGNGDGGNGDGNGGDGNGSSGQNLPHTGSPDGLPTYALVASALVLSGGAALLIIPRRRRRASR